MRVALALVSVLWVASAIILGILWWDESQDRSDLEDQLRTAQTNRAELQAEIDRVAALAQEAQETAADLEVQLGDESLRLATVEASMNEMMMSLFMAEAAKTTYRELNKDLDEQVVFAANRIDDLKGSLAAALADVDALTAELTALQSQAN